MLERQLKENQLHLQELVEERTKELQDALNVKSRFVATVSHGKCSMSSCNSDASNVFQNNRNTNTSVWYHGIIGTSERYHTERRTRRSDKNSTSLRGTIISHHK
jgi:anthranilate/para-aminobenzoate synthase component II